MKTKFLLFIFALFCGAITAFGQAAPTAATVSLNQSVTLTVAVAVGTAPFTYQWQKNGVNIPDAVNNRWYIAAAAPADVGNYACIITNAAGSTTAQAVLSLAIIAPAGGTITIVLGPKPAP